MLTQPYPSDRWLCLNGRTPIREFVRFARVVAKAGQSADEIQLTKEWRAANSLLRDLEVTEAGYADAAELDALPADLIELAEAELRDPGTRRSLDLLPYRWALVELDRLVVFQKTINLSFVETLKCTLPSPPTPEGLTRFVIGEREPPSLQITPVDGNTFSFSSPSQDLRVLSTVTLDPKSVHGHELYGRTSSVLGIFIGYGSNIFTGIRLGKRVLLLNGTHRAYTLRANGITHAPCLIRCVSTADDLDLVNMPEIRQNFDRYFVNPRPPLSKTILTNDCIK